MNILGIKENGSCLEQPKSNIENRSLIPSNLPRSEENKSTYDNIILEEDRKKGALSLKIYAQYFRFNGGPLMIFAILFCK